MKIKYAILSILLIFFFNACDNNNEVGTNINPKKSSLKLDKNISKEAFLDINKNCIETYMAKKCSERVSYWDSICMLSKGETSASVCNELGKLYRTGGDDFSINIRTSNYYYKEALKLISSRGVEYALAEHGMMVLCENKHDAVTCVELAVEHIKNDRVRPKYATLACIYGSEIGCIMLKNGRWNDKNEILTLIKKYPEIVKRIDSTLRMDKKFILLAIKENPKALEYAYPPLKEDVDIINAIKKSSLIKGEN